jgi:hypothetical protein
VAALRAAVEAATFAPRADTTPPNLTISECPRGKTAARTVRVRWIAIDETSVPCDNTNPEAVLYSWRLVGREADWTPWSAQTWVTYQDLAAGQYRFEVRAKDAAGNTPPTVTREFEVVAPAA